MAEARTGDVPRPEDIDLIITDVDGTLLDTHHKLHPRTYHALAWVRRNKPNLPIVIATGKQRSAVREIREPLNLDIFPASHLNGCVVYEPHGKVRVEVGLDVAIIVQLYEEFLASHVSMLFYDRERAYEVQGSDGPYWGEKMRGFGEHVVTADSDFINKVKDGSLTIIKAALCQPAGPKLDASRASLSAHYKPDAFTLTQAVPFCLELIPSTASKGIALTEILGTRIDATRVLAFGDGENDVSMFKVAGYSVSMANAMPVAREHATYSTSSNDEGGGKDSFRLINAISHRVVGAFLERIYDFSYESKPHDYWLQQ